MKIQALRGTKDILPEEAGLWSAIEAKAKALCRVFGYQEIRTPLLEEAGLFTRSIGKSSDIVRKEMYTFSDRKKRMLSLRPEGTACVVRAYIEHALDKTSQLTKLYYLGPMFRAERPQAGRLRQFHHIGVEAIGSADPYLDAEVIALAVKIIEQLGVKGYKLKLNTLGCEKDRKKYKTILREKLKQKLKLLCADCRARYKTNVLRVFDCKNPDCKNITQDLPGTDAHLCPECLKHHAQVKLALESLRINYVSAPHLVRGLDYYTRTCFEISHHNLGAQDAIGAGGRYDNLIGELGGPQTPAVGFALGIERVIAAMTPGEIKPGQTTGPCLYCAVMGPEAKKQGFHLLAGLRAEGISCEMDYQNKSLKAQMRQANKLAASYAAIIGEEELKKNTIILRDMQNKTQIETTTNQLVKELKQCSGLTTAEN